MWGVYEELCGFAGALLGSGLLLMQAMWERSEAPVVGALILLLAMTGFSAAAEGNGFPMIVGHRGSQGEGNACENTMKAFEWSWSAGVEMVELDVRATADGVLVAMHDETVDRTTDGSGRLDGMTWGEVSELRMNAGAPAGYGECGVPRLDTVLGEAKRRGVGVVLHAKEEATFLALKVVLEEVDLPRERVVVFVDGVNVFHAVRVFGGGAFRLWCGLGSPPRGVTGGWKTQRAAMGIELIMFSYAQGTVPTAEEVQLLQDFGLGFGASMRSGGADSAEVLRAGADVLLTNFPRRAVRFLGEGVALESPYLDWLAKEQIWFVIGEGSVHPDADPDGDGLTNLMELALAMDPRVRSEGLLGRRLLYRWPEMEKPAGGGLKFSYRVDEAALAGSREGEAIEVWAEYSKRGVNWSKQASEDMGGGLYKTGVTERGRESGLFRLRVRDPNGVRKLEKKGSNE